MSDLPYRAEYAKSGRASCKGCKGSIEKEGLRLAVMVQSPHFDGKVPYWYHYMCFFGKQRPKNVLDIDGFESLRWEDQQKITDKLKSVAGSVPSPSTSGAKKGKKRAAANDKLKDFSVEYAKSSRATCIVCGEKLIKDEIRVSKKDFEDEKAKRFGGFDRWHHVACFASNRIALGYFESGGDLPGAKTLSKEDQVDLKKKIPKMEPIKIKSEDEPDVPVKKPKVESGVDENEMKKQSKTMFTYRDKLKKLSKKELQFLLENNDQEIPAGESAILDVLCDMLTFGALDPCPKCKGQLVYKSGVGYQCTGDATEWAKCDYSTDEPSRRACVIPADYRDEHPFLKSYKYKPKKRVFRTYESAGSSNGSSASIPRKELPVPPLRKLEFVIHGKTATSKEELKNEIIRLGGKVIKKIHESLAAVISTKEEVDKMGSRISEAKEMNIQVVSEDFVKEARGKSDVRSLIIQKSICDWGSNPMTRLPDVAQEHMKSMASRSMFTKSLPTSMKLKVKGGAVVNPDSGLEDKAHVLKHEGDPLDAVLGLTDLRLGKNSYYKLQVLESDKGHQYWVFRSWGRIGTTVGNNKLERMDTKSDAVHSFMEQYEDKTGNCWDDRKSFVKIPGKYYPLDIDYGEENEPGKLQVSSSLECKLPQPVQNLITLIFDVDNMKRTMKEFELDLVKMPLGKLSQRQIQQAYTILTDLQEIITTKGKAGNFMDASNRFYTLIPHDFGMENPPLLNSEELIKSKIEMLESLMEIEIAYNLMKSYDGDSSKHPVEHHYEKLKTDIEVVDKESEMFGILQKYVKNTHAETHGQYDLDVIEVFQISRHGEGKRYKPFRKLHNRKLLWHGSRLTNYAGILSQGLRIAPPEAPVTGYMFGKGIYFADMVSKSANYCCTSSTNSTGILLLCEVALGNMMEKTNADFIEKLPKNVHSVKGVGMTQPDPQHAHTLPDGVEIPLGKGVPQPSIKSSLLYNEYIVYDVAQVNIRYALKVNFKYKY
ncbi:poly [ADP-ribose] polymerase [Ischnura elegans]|uniref:poly [ADP-ribose] polymerase n=1 Tax=Ischnura elegans TaxID=197161 RepID=UPI001ED8B5A3|nr:poly [ADP-ribose] polymerase [Ischnura elegans]